MTKKQVKRLKQIQNAKTNFYIAKMSLANGYERLPFDFYNKKDAESKLKELKCRDDGIYFIESERRTKDIIYERNF